VQSVFCTLSLSVGQEWHCQVTATRLHFVLYHWVLDRNGTVRWQLQDYILYFITECWTGMVLAGDSYKTIFCTLSLSVGQIWYCQVTTARLHFVLYHWVLDRYGTVRWQLQDYILINILKWKNLGKPVSDIFSLAWKPIRITQDNIPGYTNIHTFFFRLKSKTRSLPNNPVVSEEAVIFLPVRDRTNPKVYEERLISLIWRARSTLICVTNWTPRFNWFTSDARGS
jgi:hypothetical protein